MVFYNCSCNFRNLEILAQSKESSSMVARYNRIFHFPVFSIYVQSENSLLRDPLLFYSSRFWANLGYLKT